MTQDGFERGVACTECKQVMPTGSDANNAHRIFRQVFEVHNNFHGFVPSKGTLNIVILVMGGSLEKMTRDNFSSIGGFTIIEALAGLEVT